MQETIYSLTEQQSGNDFLSGYPDVLTPEQVQKILNTGRNTVYGMLKSGTIRSLMIGGKYRIPKLYVRDFLYGKNNSCEFEAER